MYLLPLSRSLRRGRRDSKSLARLNFEAERKLPFACNSSKQNESKEAVALVIKASQSESDGLGGRRLLL